MVGIVILLQNATVFQKLWISSNTIQTESIGPRILQKTKHPKSALFIMKPLCFKAKSFARHLPLTMAPAQNDRKCKPLQNNRNSVESEAAPETLDHSALPLPFPEFRRLLSFWSRGGEGEGFINQRRRLVSPQLGSEPPSVARGERGARVRTCRTYDPT